MSVDSQTKPKYSRAKLLLRFRCHGCGNCCRGDGYVFLEDAEIRRLAVYLDLSVEEFTERYTRTIESGRLVLKDQDDADKSCVFLKENRCTVHEAKPDQCRDFPRKWRPSNIETFCEGWREAAGLPPIGKKAKQEHG